MHRLGAKHTTGQCAGVLSTDMLVKLVTCLQPQSADWLMVWLSAAGIPGKGPRVSPSQESGCQSVMILTPELQVWGTLQGERSLCKQ